ncbi:MAG: CoA transferase [Actinobacteria bacterium]|nr:CoA transferase [Actinomycetota bacterium]MCG2799007.1 CoA transferase [Cellulomonas sp.]
MSDAMKGVKVLDLSRVLAGPYCAAIFADMGAEVLKVEEPGRGDEARMLRPFSGGESAYYITFNRGKKGVTLNLKKGKDLFLRLVGDADILVENFRPGVMERLGLGYEALREINPGLVYVAISGYGQTGPNRLLPGYDPIAQAMSGICSVTGWPDADPVRCGAPVGDVLAGLNAAIGALAALRHRDLTGQGQLVDIALVDSSVSALSSLTQVYLSEGRVPARQGNGTEAAAPGGSCHAADGVVVFAAGNDRMWPKLCEVMGRPELATDPRFVSNAQRVQHREELAALVDDWASAFTVAEVVDKLRSAGLPAGPVLTIDQVVADPHLAGARDMFVTVDHPIAGPVRITNSAIKMSLTPPKARISSPTLGEHNNEIYQASLGLTENEINALAADGVI